MPVHNVYKTLVCDVYNPSVHDVYKLLVCDVYKAL